MDWQPSPETSFMAHVIDQPWRIREVNIREEVLSGAHLDIFRIIKNLASQHRSRETLTAEVARAIPYEYQKDMPSQKDVPHSLERARGLLIEHWEYSHLTSLAREMTNVSAHSGRSKITRIAHEITRTVTEATEAISPFQPIKADAQDLYNQIVNDDEMAPIPTGFNLLDKTFMGYKPGHLYLVAGNTGSGKTAFACQAAITAIDECKRVAFWSAEMSRIELVKRLVSIKTGISTTDMERGRRTIETETELSKFFGSGYLDDTWIHDRNLPFESFCDELTDRHCEAEFDFVVVDYLQLVRMQDSRISRFDSLGLVANGLKDLSKELGVPVLVPTQLNRENSKENVAPQVHHLRGSGEIEQAADVIMALWCKNGIPSRPIPYSVEFAVLKNRTGRLIRDEITFTPTTTTFTERAFA